MSVATVVVDETTLNETIEDLEKVLRTFEIMEMGWNHGSPC